MNEWRRERPWRIAALTGAPVYMGNDAWYIPPDPIKEREEFVRQLAARTPLAEGETVMPFEVGVLTGMRIFGDEAPDA